MAGNWRLQYGTDGGTGVGRGVDVGVAVSATVGVAVGVSVGVAVGVLVGVAVGVEQLFAVPGVIGHRTKSMLLLFVSIPSGRREIPTVAVVPLSDSVVVMPVPSV